MSECCPEYLEQSSAQTLAQGLSEYYAHNPGLLDPERLPPHAARLFRQHDVAHVVFGCDTSLRGETLVDTWTIFATSAGLRGYLEYLKLPQVNELFSRTGYARIALELLRAIPDVIRVVYRSLRAKRKWQLGDWEQHLERPLRSIREQFGVRVV